MIASNIEQILEMQTENYKNRIGTTFGIFRIDDIQYNWQAHTQEWTISCTKCGYSETDAKRENIKRRKDCGVSQQKIAYRMKHMGMTFEQAISTPNITVGRPKKQEKTA